MMLITMSNQCSNSLFNYRSFSPFTPSLKPFVTTLRPIFPFHNNLIQIDRRSRNRTSLLLPPLPALSSSDKVLIATTKHSDGSIVFRFGDPSEVVKNDMVVEEIESRAELESTTVNVLDGDQVKQVIVKKIKSGYGSDGGRLTEEADGIRTVDGALSSQSDAKLNSSLDSLEGTVDKSEDIVKLDGDESLNPANSLLGDCPKDAANDNVESELQDININEGSIIDEMPPSDSLGVEPTSDVVSQLQSVHVKVEATTDVSSTKPMDDTDRTMEDELQQVSMQISDIELENSIGQNQDDGTLQAIDITENSKGQNLDDGTLQAIDKTDDSPVSVNLETEVMDVTKPYAENELHKVEPEDPCMRDKKHLMSPATMCTSDIELRVTEDVDVEEGLQDMNIIEGSLIDEMPPSNPSSAKAILDEVSQVQSSHSNLETTMEVMTAENIDVKVLPEENKLQQMSMDNGDENDVAYVMPVSSMEEAEPILEEQLSQPQSTPLELNPTMKVSDIELQDTMGLNLNDGVLQFIDGSHETETPQVSHVEVMDVSQLHSKDELRKANMEDTSESNMTDLMLPETMHISDVELPVSANEVVEEGLLDINVNEGTLLEEMPPSNSLGAEPAFNEINQLELEMAMEVPNTKGMDGMDQAVEDKVQQVSTDNKDENDVAHMISTEPFLKEEVSQLSSTSVELKPTMQVEDTTGPNLDEEMLQVINEDAGDSYIKDIETSSHQLEDQAVQDEGRNHSMLEQCSETDALGSPLLVEQGSHDSLLEAERMEVMVSSSELAEASENRAIPLTADTKVEREENHLTGYFLSSGAALLEHPSKALAGGDDAYFVAGSKWLGVANGVGQWSFEGIDPGVYSQVLMRTCEEIVLGTSIDPATNPVELLCRGVKETKMSGSSNILIANFYDQVLHVANIGDTGFLIIRHGAVYKKSSPLLHEFHFAMQVEDCDDPLQLVEEHKIELEEGDIVVCATDGLFDNLYEGEIAMIISKLLQARMKPEEIANILAIRAQEVGRSALVRSPFSDAAQAAGYTSYAGGKPDHVAVIVSLVEKRSNLLTD